MQIVKCSDRAARTVCDKCGKGGTNRETSDQLYWGHDLDKPGYKTCHKCERRNVSFVLLDPDGSRHDCTGRYSESDDSTSGATAEVVESSYRPPVIQPKPQEVTPPAGAGDRMDALNALLDLLAPKVDAGQVRDIIRSEFSGLTSEFSAQMDAKIAAVSLPTVVEVKREDGTVKVVPGAHVKLPLILTVVGKRKHVLMVGPAGTGKSTIADHAAEALGLPYYSISLSPQTPASSILGYMQAAGEYVRSLYREAYEHGGVFHFDEFDNAHPSVLAVINASLANGQMAFPDQMVKRHPDFVCVASANTYGRGADRAYVGRQAIDAATLDRFVVVPVDVDEALEESICHGTGADSATVANVLRYVRGLRRNAESHKLPLVFSPRASEGCCTLLVAGLSVSEVIDIRVRRGISDADWSKVTSGVAPLSV